MFLKVTIPEQNIRGENRAGYPDEYHRWLDFYAE
jgi:hypothetical protein